MVHELAPIEISQTPELARLAHEVKASRRPRVLRDHGENVAVIMPLHRLTATRHPLPAVPKGGVITATAGMLASDLPALSADEERDAFERGLAEQVEEELEG
jgi:hypothetical protein